MLGFPATKKDILRVTAVFAIALNASACSSLPSMPSVPDWVDPTTWFGDDSSTTANDNGQTPDLAGLPDKPATSTADEQKQVAESLSADRSTTQYSADALRGGTESAAAPPPDLARSQVASGSDSIPAAESKSASRRTAPAPAEQPRTARVDRSVAQAPEGPSMPGTLPSPGSATRVASVAAPAEPAAADTSAPIHSAADTSAPVQSAAAPPPGMQPAVPPTPAVPQQVAWIAPSDAALGFKPSAAPPLDPSVSQFVAPSILQHYQRTAANAGLSSGGRAVAVASTRSTRLRKPRAAEMGEGGPETMTGAVVANLDALQPTTSTPNVYADPQGLPATAVVFFPGDSVYLNAEARAQVRVAAEQFKARGGQGSVRVVGHSSSRTANMPLERHLEIIFRKSQERAHAVVQELVRDGVPAGKVLMEAVGDSQSVYYESMPKGEDGNRRAEIFLQG
jgi:outer membrane protein OmpA-like peptidoglycan-associated protein